MDSTRDAAPPPRLPRRTRPRRYPLVRAVADSLADLSFKPLLDYARNEWKYAKKYPGFLTLCLLLCAAATSYAAKWWYVQKPYAGETKISLFFPGDGSEPQSVSKANIYRAATMAVEMQF